ncbi:Stp1/IreP family PP2C-type Ser/Thr phosphatase [Bacillus sp. 2205SS5-2]|uniref:Stp1/IreP family PP2C-type Ser/Thr phosphatase n=1 Tax=Bacillus sp. 2205SS5-2 TaxID=3109031 RepID=UPI0030042120
MKAVFFTDTGKVRQHNEDHGGVFVNSHGDRLAIVADGMGGHNAGDIASEMAVELLAQYWQQTDKFETAQASEDWFNTHILNVNKKIYEHASEHPGCEGMGTTVVAAICTNRFLTIANIGDSRGYIHNETGLHQMTNDHSFVNELVRTGQISREDAEMHPRKNVLLRALGTENSVEVDVKTIMFEEEDLLLLCSDGLSNKLSEDEMMIILTSSTSLQDRAQNMIGLANEHGGEDNISIVLLEYVDGYESR